MTHAPTTIAPAVRVGIPAGIDPESVRSRKVALIAAGTPEVIADSLALTAAEQQNLRDHQLKLEPVVVAAPMTVPLVGAKTARVTEPAITEAPKSGLAAAKR